MNEAKVTLSPKELDQQALIHANEWLMIPLTRCISTLVIQLTNRNSALSRILVSVADNHKDFVEVQNEGEIAKP